MTMKLIGAVSAFALMSGVAWADSPGAQGSTAHDSAAQRPAEAQAPATPGMTSGAADQNLRPGDAATSGFGAGMASVDKLMGRDVIGRDGEKLGEVEDVILGPGGQAQKLVLSRGGFLGMGEKQVAIDFDQLQSRPDDDKLHASALSADDVRNMPGFEYDDGMTSLNRNRTGAAGTATDAPAVTGTPGAEPAPNATGTTTTR